MARRHFGHVSVWRPYMQPSPDGAQPLDEAHLCRMRQLVHDGRLGPPRPAELLRTYLSLDCRMFMA
eukprot:353732-Chlamydomonas_euryale.AAC.5